MRKVLLNTTALVAAGLLVTSVAYADEHEAAADEEVMAEEEMMADEEMAMEEAMASEPVSLGISGYAYAAFGASNDEAASPAMYQLVDVNLSGSATMDNGLTFSVASKLRDAAEQIVTVEGAFGSVQLGEARSARGGSRIASSGATGMFGVNGPYVAGTASTVATNGVSHGAARDPKVVYTSPAIAGITVAASYAPGGTATAASVSDDHDEDGDHTVTAASSSPSDQVSAALTFTQELGDASVSVNLGYEVANDGDGDGPEDLNAGASIAVGDITLSGGMRDSNDSAGNEVMHIDVGASLAMGPLTLSAGWGNTDTTDMYALAAGYPLGEGVALDVQLDFGDDGTDEWVQFMIGTGITF